MDPTPRGTEAWWRLFHYNNSLENSDSVRIGEYLKKNKISFQEAIYHYLDKLELSENGRITVERVKETVRVLGENKFLDISDLLLEIYDLSGLVRHLNRLDTIRAREAFLNLRKLHEMAEDFEKFHNRDLFGFIDYLEILDEMEGNPASVRIRGDDAVSLMSIHAAKGLEFKVVFVTNMAKDKFPLSPRGGKRSLIPLEMMDQYKDIFSSKLSKKDLEMAIKERKSEIRLEEERRLCYVALTRAKEDLILTLSTEYNGKEREPSEFLMELGYDRWRNLEVVAGKESINKEIEISFDVLDLSYRRDLEIKTAGLVRDNELEREKNRCIQLLIESLDKDLEEAVHYLMVYRALRDGGCGNYLEELHQKWSTINPSMRAGDILTKVKNRSNGLKFNPETFSFNFSSLKAYENCPKQYELQEILRMPCRKNEDSKGALAKGSYVHKVLETAVKEKIAEKQALYEIAEILHKKPDWMYIDLESTIPLFEVFWLRNKDRISNNLMVEQWFSVPLKGFVFKGKIDRIDLLYPSTKEVEIIDYKTGKSDVSPEERSKQLLLYAKGFEHMYPEYRVRRLTLDMLEQEKPLSFELDGDGEFKALGSRAKGLDIGAINAMVETARNISNDYEHGFKETEDPESCKGCGFRLYCDGINF